jgi:hypothetical protein
MWNFLLGFFLGRGIGAERWGRAVLLLMAVGVVLAGLIYTAVVFRAVQERTTGHVYTYSTH